jgi:hypothetical protein
VDRTTGVVVAAVKSEELADFLRLLFREAKVHKFRKLLVNLVSDSNYWEVIRDSREAILDNIDLGLYINTWKLNQLEDMIEFLSKISEMGGVMIFCSKDNRQFMLRMKSRLPQSLIANLTKDYCSSQE